ncbi:hypothetical protein KDH_56700 [Dictyobacter sp. S3.2.2.5]|uniref:Uncharacterized protein n=1 Tax=Dictyobacter halimunensis TaxID=3026934 RepID=A0ABQ6G232_9CHLR|nr:hypothetical protein KDH_56700 [Dictyobacter sp. S3.2.2.5]
MISFKKKGVWSTRTNIHTCITPVANRMETEFTGVSFNMCSLDSTTLSIKASCAYTPTLQARKEAHTMQRKNMV